MIEEPPAGLGGFFVLRRSNNPFTFSYICASL